MLDLRAASFLAPACLAACGPQSLPPFPERLFQEISRRCDFKDSTYRATRSLLLDSALIDFSKESDPQAAHRCFDKTLADIEREIIDGPNPPDSFGYVWDTQE